jgi:hypothetical protein
MAMLGLAEISWPRTLADWQGSKAPIEVLANVVTPITALVAVIGLIINGRAANRTFEHSRNSQLISTFQKAAEMLNSGSEATSSAGIALLQEIAFANEGLKVPVLDTLEGYINEKDAADWLAAPTTFIGSIYSVPMSRASCLRAIRSASFIHFPKATGPLIINRPYLVRYNYPTGSTLGGLSLANARLHYFTFFGCFFTGSTVTAQIGENVLFDKCNFAGATFYLNDLFGVPIEPEDSYRVAFVNSQQREGFTVNGLSIDDWEKRAPPPPARDRNGVII